MTVSHHRHHHHRHRHPPCFFVALLTFAFVFLGLGAREALAEPCPAAPPAPTSTLLGAAIVRVDAYEHASFGVVVGSPNVVLVPFFVIEVDRPGRAAAIVIDAHGIRHDAVLVAIDRANGLALLRVDSAVVLAEQPMMLREDVAAAAPPTPTAPCLYTLDGLSPSSAWRRYERTVHDGAPIVDSEGRLVSIGGSGHVFSRRPPIPTTEAIRRLVGQEHDNTIPQSITKRPLVFYGGGAMAFELTPVGGGHFSAAWGAALDIAARYRDILELRVDGTMTFLFRRQSPDVPECGEPPCFGGVRFTLTPSIGPRIRLGFGARADSIAITPSIGYALGAQSVTEEAHSYEAHSPSTWGRLAVGMMFSYGPGEVRMRMRLPRGELTMPTYELATGFTF